MQPKLYEYSVCPFCCKVKAILALKNISYDSIEVHPLNKKELDFSPEYRKVPIYIDSQGKQVNDSNVIMRHIDKEFPETQYFTDSELEHKWMNWSESLVQGLPTVIYNNLGNSLKGFNYITRAGKFSWWQRRVIKYSGAFVMTMVAKKIAKRQNIDNPEQFLRDKAAEWTDGLGAKAFIEGDTPNGADIAVYGIIKSVEDLNAGDMLKTSKPFWDWFERMEAKAANAKQGAQPAAV